jgi:hypothetical protein
VAVKTFVTLSVEPESGNYKLNLSSFSGKYMI